MKNIFIIFNYLMS